VSSGSVSATIWLGRPNFKGRPRRFAVLCDRPAMSPVLFLYLLKYRFTRWITARYFIDVIASMVIFRVYMLKSERRSRRLRD
jgi:hypothetical protein